MTMTRKAINELMQLRGSQVEIFGQPVTLPNTVDDLEIDTINILEDMEEYELDWYDFRYCTEDEDGNELLVQATAMQTAGGVDSVEDAYDFELLLYKCEQLLTARQMEIIKLVLQGYKQSEIAIKLHVRESTINNHMAQIRERMTAAGVSLKK